MSPNMSENKTNNTVICDSCGHSARIHPQLADKYVQPMAEIFKVLGDPTRIKILELLSHEDMCVSNIAEMMIPIRVIEWRCGLIAIRVIGAATTIKVIRSVVRNDIENDLEPLFMSSRDQID